MLVLFQKLVRKPLSDMKAVSSDHNANFFALVTSLLHIFDRLLNQLTQFTRISRLKSDNQVDLGVSGHHSAVESYFFRCVAHVSGQHPKLDASFSEVLNTLAYLIL